MQAKSSACTVKYDERLNQNANRNHQSIHEEKSIRVIDGTTHWKNIIDYPEHDACDAKDDGDEAGVVDRKILRRHRRLVERPGCRWLTWIVGVVLRHLSESELCSPLQRCPSQPFVLSMKTEGAKKKIKNFRQIELNCIFSPYTLDFLQDILYSCASLRYAPFSRGVIWWEAADKPVRRRLHRCFCTSMEANGVGMIFSRS